MTLQFWYNGSQLAAGTVRIDEVTGLTSSAESGTVGMSQIVIDDPDGSLTITGLKPFYVVETQCSEPRVWTGYLAERQLARGREEHLIAGARTHVCTLMDLNANLGFRVFTQDAAKRPRETDVARVAWMLTQTQATDDSRINDNGLVSTANAGQFDEADYRGQFAGDLLASVAASSVKNYYMYWDSATAEASLYYDKPDAAVRTSTLQISNVDTDVDDTTTFAPVLDAVLTRDPSSTYSGVWYGWLGGQLYVENAATETAFIARDAVYSTDRIGRLATAQTQSAAWLDVRSGEQDRIHVTIQVPLDRVNLILEGQRLQVKFSHLPSYTSYTYVRVARRTFRLVPSDPRLYELELELTNSTPVPGSSGSPGGMPWQCDVPTGAPVFVQVTGARTNGIVADGTRVVSFGAAPVAGNTIFLQVQCRSATVVPSIATPTGWTKDFDVSNWGSGDFDRAYLFRKVSQGSGDTSVTLTEDSSQNISRLNWVLAEYSGMPNPLIEDSSTNTEKPNGGFGDGLVVDYGAGPRLILGLCWSEELGANPGVDSPFTERLVTETGGAGLDGSIYFTDYLIDTTAGSTQTNFSNTTVTDSVSILVVYYSNVTCAAPTPGQDVNAETPTPAPNGSAADFTTTYPYATGSLLVFCDGINVNAQMTETDPATGSFALDFAPLATDVLTTFYRGR